MTFRVHSFALMSIVIFSFLEDSLALQKKRSYDPPPPRSRDSSMDRGAEVSEPVDFASLPTSLKQDPTCIADEKMSDLLSFQVKLGWENASGAPDWLETLCPEVVDHFNRFPSYREVPTFEGTQPPVQTTNYAAQTVCTMKIVQQLAASVNSRLYLHAGSHLGAIIHGQPIPWDDDADLIMDYEKMNAFMGACAKFSNDVPLMTHPRRVALHCMRSWNGLKVWLQPEGMHKDTRPEKQHYSPFVDLFLFQMKSGRLYEVRPNGLEANLSWDATSYFPTRPFYFGGIHLMGPQAAVSEHRYHIQNCVFGDYNHRFEVQLHGGTTCLNCRKLYQVFPFIYNTSIKCMGILMGNVCTLRLRQLFNRLPSYRKRRERNGMLLQKREHRKSRTMTSQT
eukprot:TRINITY_DN65604_c0_g1_i1.p1 TRINITY_DN65604_c0_g1~~TRINITY_DN65604_c0_g1_i1.p1  ORF type:complete len:414 (+),score=9.00 TRINITY_DN65604_c0_g1_i1:65-1243(+)